MAVRANKEITVNHEGRQKFIDLFAGNAFTLAYVNTQIRAEFSTFDYYNYELQYVPPGKTSHYLIDSDQEMMRALRKFEDAKIAVKLTTTKRKTCMRMRFVRCAPSLCTWECS